MEPYSSDDVKRRKEKFFFERREPEEGFKLLKREFEISGTRYRIQVGVDYGRYVFNLLEDKTLIDSHIFEYEEHDRFGLPRQNLVVMWILEFNHDLNIEIRQIADTFVEMMNYLIYVGGDRQYFKPV